MANRDLLAIGTSAGGVEALQYLAARFPADLPASVLMTIHLSGHGQSSLDEILTRAGPLPASFAKHGEVAQRRRIYIAPSGRHLLLDGDRLSLGAGPRENNVRPAIDPMLRAAALCCGHRTIGIVLTGTQGDGASGLWAINQCGGTTVVQDPQDAAFPEMPMAALNKANPQHIVPLAELPALIAQLTNLPAEEPRAPPANLRLEVEVARTGRSNMTAMDQIGRRSVLACPDCHGVMWEIDEGDLIRYRCHVGHGYTAETMSLGLDDNLRRALASALRALDERVALAERLRSQAMDRGHRHVAQHWASRKREFEDEAEVVRRAFHRADEIDVQNQQGTSSIG
jgi:two-component system chemotaxis response regulator CheB